MQTKIMFSLCYNWILFVNLPNPLKLKTLLFTLWWIKSYYVRSITSFYACSHPFSSFTLSAIPKCCLLLVKTQFSYCTICSNSFAQYITTCRKVRSNYRLFWFLVYINVTLPCARNVVRLCRPWERQSEKSSVPRHIWYYPSSHSLRCTWYVQRFPIVATLHWAACACMVSQYRYAHRRYYLGGLRSGEW